MKYAALGIGLSLAVHAGVGVVVAGLPKTAPNRKPTMITMTTPPRPKPKKVDNDSPPPEPEPPKPAAPPPPQAKAKAAPPPDAPPPPAAAAPVNAPVAANAAPATNLPDFGLSLGNGGPGGIAIPTGGANAAKAAPADASALKKPVVSSAPASNGCSEEPSKPKALGAVQPAYTDAARSANIEGRVRVSLRVDATGAVTSATVQSGLGYGLDEAAVAAAKRMKFDPAKQCGKAVDASFVVSMRFVLGE